MATLFHLLKNCKNGWSEFRINNLDVRKIKSYGYNKRLFCIFDIDHPYNFWIKYENPHSESDISPVFVNNKWGYAITEKYSNTSIITKRYKSEEDILIEINEIKRLLNVIQQFDNEQISKLNELSKNSK